MSQPAPSRRQLMIRWAIFVAILAVAWAVRRRETPPAERAERIERSGTAAAERTAPPVEPGWKPPPRSPAAEDAKPAGTAADRAAAEAQAEPDRPPRRPSERPQGSPRRGAPAGDGLVIEGLSLRNADGRTIYRGAIDLAPTLERIAAGKRLRFPNDGATFQNRERRLPGKPAGYYREWVVPTPGEPGPGPQRLVTGEDGEVWYTSDHYRSFRRISTKALSP
jgi:hypothetical protein